MSKVAVFGLFVFVALGAGSCSFYTLKECGFGAFAYSNPMVAAMTGQCK